VRPVGKERPSERTRGKASRSPARGIARSPAQAPSGRRSRSSGGVFSRLFRFIGSLVDFRSPMLWLASGVIILTVGAAVLAGGYIDRTVKKTDAAAGAMVSGAGFAVTQMHLAGNIRTKPAAVVAALDLKAGQSIFGINLRAARARLLTLPWIADAQIKRRYPDDISVRLVERVPFARWQTPKGVLVVVERHGRVITSVNAEPFSSLPLLLGSGAPVKALPVVDAVARHRGIVSRVRGYQFQSLRRWNLLLDDGVVVKLPETGFEKQLQDLDRLIVEKGILESDIREIDLRHPFYFFFVRRNGTEQKDRKTENGSAI
jgi:cell division protein FtsQ